MDEQEFEAFLDRNQQEHRDEARPEQFGPIWVKRSDGFQTPFPGKMTDGDIDLAVRTIISHGLGISGGR